MHLQLQLANHAFEPHSLQISVGDNRYFFIIKFTCLVTTIVELVDSLKLDQKLIRGCSTPFDFERGMGDLMGLRKNFFSPNLQLVIEYFSLTYKAIVWQIFLARFFLCSKSDFRMFFSEITRTTPAPPQKSNGRPLISSLHMIGHGIVLHNYCETHQGPDIIYPLGGGVSRNLEPKEKFGRIQRGGPLKLA